MGETLGTYLVRTRRLLHDLPQGYIPNPANTTKQTYYSDYDLTSDINDSINQRDLWGGGTRSYQAGIPLTIGQDTYTFPALFPTLYAAGQTVLDVVNVILIYGNTRVPLNNPSFTDLTTKARALVNYQNRPWGFTRYGAAAIYIAPAPGAIYTCDFDTVLLSTTLVTANDPDPLPFPYTPPVPYYAAYLAKLNMRRFDEAETFFGYYIRAMRDIEGARVGQMLSAYQQTRGGYRAS